MFHDTAASPQLLVRAGGTLERDPEESADLVLRAVASVWIVDVVDASVSCWSVVG